MTSGEVGGHTKSLKIGTIDGRGAMLFGRVHPNEDLRDPDLNQAMRIVIGGARDRLDGLLITNGVGTLHGPIGLERGRFHSLIQTGIIDTVGWAVRGKRKDPIAVGELALVGELNTMLLGACTPLLAGEFEDAFSAAPGNTRGIHRDDNYYFNIAQDIITQVQGRCPVATDFFIPGPQFEGPMVKKIARLLGSDVIGMSGQEVLLATAYDIPFAQVVFSTNGPFETHSHKGNGIEARKNSGKMGRVLEVFASTWPQKS